MSRQARWQPRFGDQVQRYAISSDTDCSSSIGPITASKLGVPTIDISAATFAMYSIRELAGSKDLDYLVRALTAFYA